MDNSTSTTALVSLTDNIIAGFLDLYQWCLDNTGIGAIIIASISLRFAYKTLKQWKIDKTISMHYKFKEERNTLLKEIDKLDQTKEPNENDLRIAYTNLLNELELISLLYQKGYLEKKISKQMFNTWVEHIYNNEDMKRTIEEERIDDHTAYEHLEKTYNEWNKAKKSK